MKQAIEWNPAKVLFRYAKRLRQSQTDGADSTVQLLKIIQNTGWLLGERAVVLGTGMLVGVWVARYLGPSDFGTYSYALSFVALFGFLPVFGLQGIVTRELVKTPESKEEILGTVLALRLAGALLGVAVIIAFIMLFPGDLYTRLMIGIIALSLPLDAFSVVDLWFQARTENKYSVLARSSAMLLGMLVKVILILFSAPLIAFAAAETLQYAFRASGFIVAYRWTGQQFQHWRRSWERARVLMGQAWPVVLSSAGALIYLKIDQVMLGSMAGSREVGIYAAAARLSEVWYVLPMAIATSIFPAIVRSRHSEDPLYHDRLQKAYSIMAWMAFAVAITVTLASGPAIRLLFGSDYAAASPILAVHIWTCPAVFMGAVLNKWLIAEDLLIFALTRHGLGAVVNVGMNLILIPSYGGMGAAIATLLSYSVAFYLACYTDRRTRPAGRMMTRALLSPLVVPFTLIIKGRNASPL